MTKRCRRRKPHGVFPSGEILPRAGVGRVQNLGGLVALLEYMAPRLQEEDAPAMLLETLVDDQEWSTVFELFCANLARGLAAIMAAESTITPERVDWVADDIIAANGDLFDDYDVVRLAARAAIQADAEYRAGTRS